MFRPSFVITEIVAAPRRTSCVSCLSSSTYQEIQAQKLARICKSRNSLSTTSASPVSALLAIGARRAAL